MPSRNASIAVAALVGFACGGGGGDGPTNPAPQPPAASVATSIVASSSVTLTGVVGQPVSERPEVIVRDQRGNVMSGAAVTFAVTAGGGSVSGAVVSTGSGGVATVGSWTLGTTAGSNTLSATAGSLTPVTFTATAAAGPAAVLTKVAGDNQTATVGAQLSVKPSVIIKDANGNAVSGVSVTFAVASGGGSITGGTQTTGTDGIATVGSWTLGTTAGTNTLSATSSGLGGSPLTFTATGNAGLASQLVLIANAAGAASGSAFTTQPAVAIRDDAGNTITTDNGSLVTMSVNNGAAVVGTATTQALAGVATFKDVGISGASGTSYTLSFARSGLAAATQSIALTPGLPTQLVLTTPATLAWSAAFAVQPIVAIRDAVGNNVPNATNTVAMTVSAGASVVGGSSIAAVGGVATFSNVGITGTPNTVYTLTFASGTLTPATQTVTPPSLLVHFASDVINAASGVMLIPTRYQWLPGETRSIASFTSATPEPIVVGPGIHNGAGWVQSSGIEPPALTITAPSGWGVTGTNLTAPMSQSRGNLTYTYANGYVRAVEIQSVDSWRAKKFDVVGYCYGGLGGTFVTLWDSLQVDSIRYRGDNASVIVGSLGTIFASGQQTRKVFQTGTGQPGTTTVTTSPITYTYPFFGHTLSGGITYMPGMPTASDLTSSFDTRSDWMYLATLDRDQSSPGEVYKNTYAGYARGSTQNCGNNAIASSTGYVVFTAR